MQNKLLVAIIFAGIANWSQAQQVPPEMQKIIDNYTRDSAVDFGFSHAKKFFSLDKDLEFSDIKVGVPLEEYLIEGGLLDKYEDTVSVKSIIVPANIWDLPIEAHGKYIYDVEFGNKNGIWSPHRLGQGIANELQMVRTARPDIFSTNPILIQDATRSYLHFPQKGSHNLLYLSHFAEDPLRKAISNSGGSLDNSRIILNYRKKEYKELREKFLKRNPNMFKKEDEFGGGK
jgi:hypothetical protein